MSWMFMDWIYVPDCDILPDSFQIKLNFFAKKRHARARAHTHTHTHTYTHTHTHTHTYISVQKAG